MTDSLSVQIVIVGGGVAGLWLLNRLRARGYQAILLEKQSLGGKQSLASQGIIHGGLKYALNGVTGPASSAISTMPQRWRDCLAGNGEVDLTGCELLSPRYHMWSSGDYRARLKTFLGSKALRGRITALDETARPAFFREQALRGTVYQLADFVLDVPSLVRTLSAQCRDSIFHTPDLSLTGVDSLSAGGLDIQADKIILCAGEGNQALLAQLNRTAPVMQRRPLHMVVVSHERLTPLYTHCIGHDFGMTPRLTITTHPLPGGRLSWYLGGEIAESGVNRSAAEQLDFARQELNTLFPRLLLHNADWQTLHIDRAEPDTGSGQRPDNAFIVDQDGLMVAWPTKLSLCPNLGDLALSALSASGMEALNNPVRDGEAVNTLQQHWCFPEYGQQPWETQTAGAPS